MASSSRGNEVRPRFSPSTLHFFKIVLEETLQQQKLLIPKTFMQKYGDTLSNLVFLKLPCGLEWELGLTNCNGKVWLDKGWPEFAEYYSIIRGSMLVFRYEGNSKFHAFIFDTTTVEIAYPTIPTPFEKSKNQGQSQKLKRKEIEDDDDSVEILEGFSPCQRAEEVSRIPCYHPPKRVKTSIGESHSKFCDDLRLKGTDFRANEAKTSMCNGASNSSESEMKGKLHCPAEDGGEHKCTTQRRIKSEVPSREKPLTNLKHDVLQIAREFKSKHPTFMVSLKPSHLRFRTRLNVPSHFVNTYLSNKPADAILKVSDGRTWYIKFGFEVCGKSRFRVRLSKGWIAFAKDNKLEVGDVCVFVLTSRIKILFEVVIFGKNRISNSPNALVHKAPISQVKPKQSLSNEAEFDNTTYEETGISALKRCQKPKMIRSRRELAEAEKAKSLERVRGFNSDNPFFVVVMQPSYVHTNAYLKVPLKFARMYINENHCRVCLSVSDGRSWYVNYKARPRKGGSGAAEFGRGWKQFIQDNVLEVGDLCIFELTNRNEISFKVSIVRVADNTYNHQLAVKPERNASIEFESGCTSNNETDTFSLSWIVKKAQKEIKEHAGVSRASEAVANQFFSTNPYFQVTMRSDFLRHYIVRVPTNFAESYFKEKANSIVSLQIGERCWPVKLLIYGSECILSRGWAAFVRENSLRPRDLCIFELIETNQIVLKVSIVRRNLI